METEPRPKFTIDIPRTDEDNVRVGEVHYQAFCDAHKNDDAGVTEEWLEQNMSFLTDESGFEYRKKLFEEAKNNPEELFYRVVRDQNGVIQGFADARRKDGVVNPVFYLEKSVRGSGAADELMQSIIRFAAADPMTLHVAGYNDRAIAFYRKYGFRRVKDTDENKFEKIPVIKMKRG